MYTVVYDPDKRDDKFSSLRRYSRIPARIDGDHLTIQWRDKTKAKGRISPRKDRTPTASARLNGLSWLTKTGVSTSLRRVFALPKGLPDSIVTIRQHGVQGQSWLSHLSIGWSDPCEYLRQIFSKANSFPDCQKRPFEPVPICRKNRSQEDTTP